MCHSELADMDIHNFYFYFNSLLNAKFLLDPQSSVQFKCPLQDSFPFQAKRIHI